MKYAKELLLYAVTDVKMTPTTNNIYSGETFRNTISAAVAAANAPVQMFSFAFFAMFIIGTAMSATTAGLIPLNIFITVGLS